MVSVGVIGVGYWGKKHVEEFRALGAEVYAADVDAKNLEICREKFGARPVEIDEMLANRDIVGVTICTPIDTHYELTKKTLQAGKNTLVEKPLAKTARLAESQVRLASQRRLLLATGHVFRFNNAVNRTKQLLQENFLGEMYIAKFTWTNKEPLYKDREIITDLALHPFDIMEYLFGGHIDEISCVGNSYRQRDLTEAAFINCRSARILVNIELSWLTPWKHRTLDLVGSERSLRVDCLSQRIDVYQSGKTEAIPFDQNNTIRDELKHFLDCIANGTRSTADGESAVMAIRMVETTRKALLEKRTQRL